MEAGDDLEETIKASFSSPSDSPEKEEVEEETDRQRREDTHLRNLNFLGDRNILENECDFLNLHGISFQRSYQTHP